MQFKQLEVFCAVVRQQSFSKAAESLYLTQPTVSAHISALEKELGLSLLHRSTKAVLPTATGRVFYRYALQILDLCAQAVQDVRSVSGEIRGILTVAASTVPSQYILPQLLPQLQMRYPEVFFQIFQADSGEVVQRILTGSAEVGIIGTAASKPNCVHEPFYTERMVIITPNTSEYQRLEGRMTPEVLCSAPYLIREAGSGTRTQSEAFFRDIGVEPKELSVVAQLQSTESVLQAVKNGLGIAIVSELAAADYAHFGKILTFDYDSAQLTRRFYAIHHKEATLSPAAELLLKELHSFGAATV